MAGSRACDRLVKKNKTRNDQPQYNELVCFHIYGRRGCRVFIYLPACANQNKTHVVGGEEQCFLETKDYAIVCSDYVC